MAEPIAQSEPDVPASDEKLVGIRGWLILPAIGLVLGPIAGVLGLLLALGNYSDVARAGYGTIYGLELAAITGLIAFTIYAARLFFRKRSNAPRAFITLLVVNLVVSGVLLMIELGAGAEVFAIATGKQLARDIVGAAIWIPYFKVSERVKATFVN